MKIIIFILLVLAYGNLLSQDCYNGTMQLAKQFYAEAKYKQATKQFKAALTCDDKPASTDSIKKVESLIKTSDSMEVVVIKLNEARALAAEDSAKIQRDIAKANEQRALSAEDSAKTQRAIAEKQRLLAEDETRKMQSKSLSSLANASIYNEGEFTKGFRYAQYALEKDTHNIDAKIALYHAVYQPRETLNHRFYKSLLNKNNVFDVKISPNGRLIASTAGTNIHLWDSHTGEMIAVLEGDTYGAYLQIEFTPDGKKLAAIANVGQVYIWDIESRKLLKKILTNCGSGLGVGMIYSPDGKKIISSDMTHTEIWDIEKAEIVRKLDGFIRYPNRYVFSPDYKMFVGSGSDNNIKV